MTKLMILLLLVVCIGMPIFYAVRIWRLKASTRAAWLLTLAKATMICLLILILGRWDMAGLYTRSGLTVIFLVAAVLSWRHHGARPWRSREQPLLGSHRSTLLSLVLLGVALIWITSGLYEQHNPVMLDFPLRGGAFVVAQGGDNILLNHHHSHPAQRYALDITAVNAIGFRASGLLPTTCRAMSFSINQS